VGDELLERLVGGGDQTEVGLNWPVAANWLDLAHIESPQELCLHLRRQLSDLIEEVGRDVARFFFLLRSRESHLDFDLELAKSQSNDNPVYYIQYAHARISAVLVQWGGDRAGLLHADVSALDSEYETQLLQRLIDFPQVIETAAEDLAPHLIAFYLKELAADFHSYYNASRFLVEDEKVKLARLALIAALAQVLKNGLALLGVSAPEKM